MNTADDLLRRALECIDWHCPQVTTLREEIRAYLDAPEMKDEPVAWMDEPVAYIDGPNQMLIWAKPFQYSGPKSIKVEPIPLYLHPPTKTAPMKPMTKDEKNKAIKELLGHGYSFVAIAIELGGPVGSDNHNELINYLINHYDIPAAPKKPMTEEEIDKTMEPWQLSFDVRSDARWQAGFKAGIRFAERHHGITDVRD